MALLMLLYSYISKAKSIPAINKNKVLAASNKIKPHVPRPHTHPYNDTDLHSQGQPENEVS